MVAVPDESGRALTLDERAPQPDAEPAGRPAVDLRSIAGGRRAAEFLRWFSSQDRIMDLGTRERLWRAWGMCDEHSLMWLAVEHSFEAGWLHGPAILYEDLIDKALWAVRPRWFPFPPTAGMLRSSAACLVCEQAGRPDQVSRDDPLASLREGVVRYLTAGVDSSVVGAACGSCAGTASRLRCRPHLVTELERDGRFDLAPQRAHLAGVLKSLVRYSRSFGWANRGADTAEDRAALVAAVGWCNGWRALLPRIS